MHKKEIIASSLAPFLADLNAAGGEWAVFGSAALVLNGMDVEAGDIDILLGTREAEILEERWNALRIVEQNPMEKKDSPFRSRLSKFRSPQLTVELSGGLEIRKAGTWQPVTVHEVHTSAQGIRFCTLEECKRLLTLFGRPKDLERLQCISRQEALAQGR